MWVLVSSPAILGETLFDIKFWGRGSPSFTVKIRVFKISIMTLNILAWNNEIGRRYYFFGLRPKVMIDGDRWGYLYCAVRGEIVV